MTTNAFEAVAWPDGFQPSRMPIHFTNEIETSASIDTVWHLITKPEYWPRFYPGVSEVTLLDGGDTLFLGARFETNLAGQDVDPLVKEFEPKTRVAWGGEIRGAEGAAAHHAWILTPTATGCHIWTEETMRGALWIDLAKEAPDRYWQYHEIMLRNLDRVAVQFEANG